ncbi:MAG: YraN family protein [Bacteroides sp.]|nr:YraN family protein [Bacteroidales bacterium]MBD5316686.1 YraN family protein [Bacteroides sp.]
MAFHNDTGKWGEQVAADYLAANGYAITDRNVRMGRNEIDIIAMKGDSIMFVEVKTRSTALKDPLDAITPDKMRRLCRAADAYIKARQLPHRPQFDLIAIIGAPGRYELEHFPDAFFPPLTSGR